MRFGLKMAALAAGAPLLVACPQSYYDHFTPQHADNVSLADSTADETYRSWKSPVEASGFNSTWYRTTHTATFYAKAYDHNGKLAVCGGFTLPDAPERSREAFSRYLSASNSLLYVGRVDAADTPRLWSAFLGANATTDLRQVRTRCVETRTEWRPEYTGAPFSIQRTIK